MPGWAAGGSPPLSSLEVQVKVEDVKGPSRPSTACRLVGILAALLVVGGTAGVAIPLALRAGATAPESDAPTVPMRASGAGVTSSLLATTRADWKEDDAVVSPTAAVRLTFSVKQSNADKTLEMLFNVSTPGHPMRSKYLNWSRLRTLVSNPSDQAHVRGWLQRSGATIVEETLHGLMIKAVAPVAVWEAALNVTIGRFVSTGGGGGNAAGGSSRKLGTAGRAPRVVHRARGPAYVPAHVAQRLAGIYGLSHLPPRMRGTMGPRARRGAGGSAGAASGAMYPPVAAKGAGDSGAGSGGAGRRRELLAAWVTAEGCAIDPCEGSASRRRRRLQSWEGSGQADHICCSGESDGSDGDRRHRRSLQSWVGSGQVDCSATTGSGAGRRSLQSSGQYQVDPLEDADSGSGVCLNGTAVNSTTIGLMRSHYEIPADSGGDEEIVMWIITPTDYPHSHADLTAFQRLYGIRPHNVTDGCFDWEGVCTHSADDDDDFGRTEANLDAQYISSAAPRAAVVDEHFITGDDECDGPTCWLQTLENCVSGRPGDLEECYGKPPPVVVSISWGVPEEDLPESQIYEFNRHAVMLALLGTTVVAAAGDGGAAGVYPYDEDEDDSGEAARTCGDTYQSLFPGSSPFVTSVGATMGIEDGRPEVACTASAGGGITTGGGISRIKYPKRINEWQTSHVKAYLASSAGQAAPDGYFMANGQNGYGEDGYSYDWHGEDANEGYDRDNRIETHRGYPDLALAGSAVQMVNDGKVILVDGTSASAPVFAAMVASVVAARKAEGISRNANMTSAGYVVGCGDYDDGCYATWNATQGYMLGWLNPTLYSNASAFTDITEGNNTDGRGITCPTDPSWYEAHDYDDRLSRGAAGFVATTGWDPVSGLGSISYPALKAMFEHTATDEGVLGIGEDYYYEYSDGETAEEEEVFSPPSPPSYWGYDG